MLILASSWKEHLFSHSRAEGNSPARLWAEHTTPPCFGRSCTDRWEKAAFPACSCGQSFYCPESAQALFKKVCAVWTVKLVVIFLYSGLSKSIGQFWLKMFLLPLYALVIYIGYSGYWFVHNCILSKYWKFIEQYYKSHSWDTPTSLSRTKELLKTAYSNS